MHDDDIPDYEYEYELPDAPKNGQITYPSGYTSEYKPLPNRVQLGHSKVTVQNSKGRIVPTPEELIILGAYNTIKEHNHKKWSDEQCLEQAIKWFNKKDAAGEITIRTKEEAKTIKTLPRKKFK